MNTPIPILSAVLVAFGLLACGSTQINQAKLTGAEAAVRSAQEVGAKNQPTAALHVELAQEQIARAKQLAEEGDAEEADLMLSRARSDAELAIQISKTEALRAEAQETWAKVERLRAEQSKQ